MPGSKVSVVGEQWPAWPWHTTGCSTFASRTFATHPASLVMNSTWKSSTLYELGRNFPSARKYSGEVGVIDIFVATSPAEHERTDAFQAHVRPLARSAR